MKRPLILTTSYSEFLEPYDGDIENHYQVHLLSFLEVLSWYFDPEEYSIEEMPAEALNIFTKVKNGYGSEGSTLFQIDGKYLITEHPEIYQLYSLFEIDSDRFCYKFPDNDIKYLDFLGKKSPSEYIKCQLTAIGAPDLYPVLEHLSLKLDEGEAKSLKQQEAWRQLDKTDPKFRLEVYRIGINYVPVKDKEFLVHGHESAMCLPEYQPVYDLDNRIVYLMIDLATNKVIDGDLQQDIESIKYHKWQRKHPGTVDLGDMQRMELDNDDPDFLSWEELVANDDEVEEGDDEYTPDFSKNE